MFNFFNKKEKQLTNPQPVGRGGWFPWNIMEPFTGAWQRNISWKRKDVISHFAIFSCISLIASDIAKLNINYTKQSSDGIWIDIPMRGFEVLNKPNPYQNRIQFVESWIISKLSRGNTYVLKTRDNNGKVVRLDVLHPDLVQVLVSDGGEVFYQLSQDNLSRIPMVGTTVPASEIIHDRFNCLYHPLIGLSPIFACGLAAFGGIKMLENSVTHFKNLSRPGGILTAPGAISDETAARLKKHWDENYGGDNSGKTAVLGDDLKYQAISVISPVDSQLVDQLKLSADIVCATFHVPTYKVVGNAPSYNNIEAQESAYYSQCLQVHIESIELALDNGLRAPEKTGFEFDIDGLLRMDSKTQVETLGNGVNKAIYSPNEARKRMNLKPVEGGDVPFLQHQMWPIGLLANRSVEDGGTQQQNTPVNDENDLTELALGLSFGLRKELKDFKYDA